MKIPTNVFNKFKFYPSSYNILIVEDSKSLVNIVLNQFRNIGYNCFDANTLAEAYEILGKIKIDFVLLDINLPDGNGYELIKKYSHTSIKIIVMSSQNDEQFREISFQKGIIDYIEKDKNFFHKLDDISLLIEKIEKNKQSNILIVEDSIVIQEQLDEILKNRNYKTLKTDSTSTILDILKNNDVDLILLDVNLKDGNGIEFLNKNKSFIIEKMKIPVIIVSGSSDTSIVREGLKAGAKDIIRKPYIIEELILKVDASIDYSRKQKENIHIQGLLQQYKETIDKSYIVSKTDKHGFITYVNDEFCKISGYERDELIGKPHNILRHVDMSSKVFEELWHTIKDEKKSWFGEVKNKRKNGSFFWAKTTINPILDEYGNIVEFIAIRNDITQEKLLKNYIKEHIKNNPKI